MAQGNHLSEEVKISIISYLSGQREQCDAQLLKEWLGESEANQHLFSQIVELWEVSQINKREKNFDVDSAWHQLGEKLDAGNRKIKYLQYWPTIGRYAAVLIIAVLMATFGYYWGQSHIRFNLEDAELVEYTAPYGSKTNLKLLDGSRVWLNAGTTLAYNRNYGLSNRNLFLDGEAYFEVEKNKKLPFVVKAKNMTVTALGTRFNVKAYNEEKKIETDLLEGSVNVQVNDESSTYSVVLKPQERAIFNSNTNKLLVSKSLCDISWFSSEWVIKNTSLGELARLLERRYNVLLNFDDEKLKAFEFKATIKDETIEQVLTAIALTAPIKYKISNNQVTISWDKTKSEQYRILLK